MQTRRGRLVIVGGAVAGVLALTAVLAAPDSTSPTAAVIGAVHAPPGALGIPEETGESIEPDPLVAPSDSTDSPDPEPPARPSDSGGSLDQAPPGYAHDVVDLDLFLQRAGDLGLEVHSIDELGADPDWIPLLDVILVDPGAPQAVAFTVDFNDSGYASPPDPAVYQHYPMAGAEAFIRESQSDVHVLAEHGETGRSVSLSVGLEREGERPTEHYDEQLFRDVMQQLMPLLLGTE